jgi:hypothetical protein
METLFSCCSRMHGNGFLGSSGSRPCHTMVCRLGLPSEREKGHDASLIPCPEPTQQPHNADPEAHASADEAQNV